MTQYCSPLHPSASTKQQQSSDSSVEDYIDRMRKSIDEIREFYPHDARKANELRPSIDQYRPSIEYRKSLDVRLRKHPECTFHARRRLYSEATH